MLADLHGLVQQPFGGETENRLPGDSAAAGGRQEVKSGGDLDAKAVADMNDNGACGPKTWAELLAV